MKHTDIGDRQLRRWQLGALLAPVAHTASGNSWPGILILGGICTALVGWLARKTGAPGKWLGLLQYIWASVVAGEVLRWCGEYWPGHEKAWEAPVILLMLSVWAASDGKRSARAGCLLAAPAAFLLGTVMLSGVRQIRWENLPVKWQLESPALVIVMLIPCLHMDNRGRRYYPGSWWMLPAALGAGIILTGVLGGNRMEAPVYEMGRSVSLFGVAERLESLVAVGMTLGFFCCLLYLFRVPESWTEPVWIRWLGPGICAGSYLSGVRLQETYLAAVTVILWIVAPVMAEAKNLKKGRKRG